VKAAAVLELHEAATVVLDLLGPDGFMRGGPGQREKWTSAVERLRDALRVPRRSAE
jgi:hypothetical protein